MSAWRLLPRHARVLLPVAAAHFSVLLVLRAVFWAVFEGTMVALPGHVLAKALYTGAKFDLRLTLLTLLPPALAGWIGPFSLVDGRPGRRLWGAYAGAAFAVTLLVYAVDFGHFAYLATRINARVLDLLADAAISLRMVWESYPVVRGTLALALVVACYVGLYFRWVRRVAAEPRTPVRRWRQTAAVAVVAVAWGCGIWGKAQWFPLRWSDAFFATDVWSPALGLNPVLNLADTLKNKARGFDEAATRAHYDEVAAFLGVDRRDPAALSFRREVPARPREGPPPNVVVILLEEAAHYKTGTFGNPLDPTPFLDGLAREGILLRRFYTPTFGTARSVFALVTGIPDVETHETATRNPLIVDQRTIVNAFNGYEKLYFLGGSLNWGNVRGVLAHNIPDVRLFEEGSYKAPRVDGWGISDLSLFEEANGVLRAIRNRPFFAIIQTAAHHRPYTIPDDNRGFVRRDVPEAKLRAAGFSDLAEFNSMRFLDHSLELFFAMARGEAYFPNTVFVLFGDHGSFTSTAETEKVESALNLTKFHVPCVIVGTPVPGAPRVVDAVASEVDVLPTIAGIAGVAYVNTTLGRDVLDPRFDAARYAFTIDAHSLDPKVGLITADSYLQTGVAGDEAHLWELSGDGTTDLAGRSPERTRALARLCRGMFQASRWLMYHNAGRALSPPPR